MTTETRRCGWRVPLLASAKPRLTVTLSKPATSECKFTNSPLFKCTGQKIQRPDRTKRLTENISVSNSSCVLTQAIAIIITRFITLKSCHLNLCIEGRLYQLSIAEKQITTNLEASNNHTFIISQFLQVRSLGMTQLDFLLWESPGCFYRLIRGSRGKNLLRLFGIFCFLEAVGLGLQFLIHINLSAQMKWTNFSKNQKLPRLTQDEMDNLSSLITIKSN